MSSSLDISFYRHYPRVFLPTLLGQEWFIEWSRLIHEDVQKVALHLRAIDTGLAHTNQQTPSSQQMWRCFQAVGTPSNVRVVVIGQDPYPTPGVADGLAFSTSGKNVHDQRRQRRPASLNNIFKLITTSYPGIATFETNDLECWARQGVLLINNTWTASAGKPRSHKALPWKFITAIFLGRLFLSQVYKHKKIVFVSFENDAKQTLRTVEQEFIRFHEWSKYVLVKHMLHPSHSRC